MAQAFNLTAQLQLQAPGNTNQVMNQIRKQLKPLGVNLKIQNAKNVAQANKNLQSFNKAARDSQKNVTSLNRTLQESARRFSVITIATGSFLALANSFKKSVKEAVAFERELVRISQVTGKTVRELSSLSDEVTRLSTSLGASSSSLLGVARTLSQAGFAADETRKALDILAKTSLGATFDSIQDTTEGAIALLRQFSNEARSAGGDIAFLEKSLDAINSVSKRFAVESGDLISAIRRTGGVFSAAGGSVNELIALFTSVRATTRESAETIATGLRTIFTRIQRTETIQQLKALNIELQDSQGQFVGAFEAVRRLSVGLSALNPKDFRFSQIVEELGGFRQIGKVIPLINQFATAQEALNVAQSASGSVSKDAQTAQQSLGVQVQKVREQFDALIRKFQDSSSFRSIAGFALQLAESFIKVADALEPLLPLLTSLIGLKLGQGLAPAFAGIAGLGRRAGGTGPVSKFARGGMVPGTGNRDTVPAMLTPGEFVIRKSSVNKLGASTLAAMNQNGYAAGGRVTGDRAFYGALSAAGQPTAGFKKYLKDNNYLDNVTGRGFNKLSESRKNAAIAGFNNQSKKSKTEADKTTGIKLKEASLNEEFGIAFLGGLTKDVSSPIKSMLKASNATGRGRFFDNLKKSANRKEIAAGIAPNKRIKTGQQALARYVPDGTRIKAPFASQNTTVLQGEGKKIFNDEITAGIPRLFQDATKKFKGELGIGAQVPLNKLLSNSAIGSIEGQFFEAYIRNVTGKIIKDKNDAIFDFAPGSLSGSKKDLDRMFGPGAFNTGIAQEFKNRGGPEQIASAIGKGLSIGTAGDLRFSFMNKGGGVSGSDTVPAMLTPGEFVFSKGAAQSIGYGNLNRMNKQGVQGFAKGGVVSTGMPAGGRVTSGRGFYGNSIEVRSVDTIKRMDDENKKRKEVGDALNNNKIKIDKTGKIIDKTNQKRSKVGNALDKLSSGASSVRRGLDKITGGRASNAVVGAARIGSKEGRQALGRGLNEAAGAAQSFVFLGASVAAVTGQMSGLEETTKTAINQTAGFAAGLVGIGGTLVQVLTSMTASGATEIVTTQANTTATVTETNAKLRNAAAGSAAAGAITTFAIGVVAGISALKYFSSKANAEADVLAKGFGEAVDSIKEGAVQNSNDLKASVRNEIEARNEAAKYTVNPASFQGAANLAGAAAGAGLGAKAGAALGTAIAPGIGTAIGGLLGAVAGGIGGALLPTVFASSELTEAQKKQTEEIYSSIDSLVSLNTGIANINQASKDLSAAEAAGIDSATLVQRGLQTGSEFGGTDAAFKTASGQLATLAEEAGKTAAQLKESDFEGDPDALILFNTATRAAASAQEKAAAQTKFSGDILQKAFKNTDPSKSFDELVAAGGPFAQALRQNISAIKEEAKIRQIDLQAKIAENQRRQSEKNSSEDQAALVKEGQALQQAYNSEVERAKQLQLDTVNGLKASQDARRAEVQAVQRAAEQSAALSISLARTDKFLSDISNAELNLDRQAGNIENFAAVVDNAALKVQASGVDEIGNVTNVSDLRKFSEQVGGVANSFGPQAKKIGEELTQSATTLKAARSLIGRNFSLGKPIDANQVLRDLGLTSQMFGPGGEKIFQQMSAALQEAASGGTLTEDIVNDIFAPLQKTSERQAEVIQRLVGVEQKSLDNYAKYLDVKEKQRQKDIEQKEKEIQTNIRNAELIDRSQQLLARSRGEEDVRPRIGAAQKEAQRRALAQPNLQGLRVNGQQIQAGNLRQVAGGRAAAIRERRNVAREIATGGGNQKELIRRQQQLQVYIDATTKELERMADQSDRASDIFEEMEANISVIEKERSARQQMLGVIEEFVVGGEDARKNLLQASQGIRVAFATGTLQNQTAEQRQATVSLLDKLADIELAPGFTGREIKQELVLRDAIRMGLDPEIARQLATATTTEEKLIQANKNLAEQIKALTEETKKARELQNPEAVAAATGGLIQYRAGGGTIFKPRGTDTVPAMLTPGEFVIRKSAVDKVGVGALQALNNGGGTVPGFANGGVVYASNGFYNNPNGIFSLQPDRTMFPKGSLVPQDLIDRNLKSTEEILEQGRRENRAFRKRTRPGQPDPLDALREPKLPAASKVATSAPDIGPPVVDKPLDSDSLLSRFNKPGASTIRGLMSGLLDSSSNVAFNILSDMRTSAANRAANRSITTQVGMTNVVSQQAASLGGYDPNLNAKERARQERYEWTSPDGRNVIAGYGGFENGRLRIIRSSDDEEFLLSKDQLDSRSQDLARDLYNRLGYSKGGPVQYRFGGGFINPFNTFPMMMGQMNAGTNFMMNRMAAGTNFMMRAATPNVRLMTGPQYMASFLGGGVGYSGGPRYEPLSQAFGGRAGRSALGGFGGGRGVQIPDQVLSLFDGNKYDYGDPANVFSYVERILEMSADGSGRPDVLNEFDKFMNNMLGNGQFGSKKEMQRMKARAIKRAERIVDTYDVDQNLFNFAVGGRVPYFSTGGSTGGDSVPAMLTPGEFVMSANAVKKHGVGFMRSLNRGQVQGFNKGGMVQYRQEGGLMGMIGGAAQSIGIDTSKIEGVFGGFVDNFSSVFDNILLPFNGIMQGLNNIADKFGNFVMTHQVNGNLDVAVNINSEAIKSEISQHVVDLVGTEVRRALKENNDDFRS